ncbi:MAG: cell division protein ZapA [Alphaproteobacteria bacterium]
MPIVPIKVAGRDYQVACGEGQEEHLRLLTDELNDRIHSLFYKSKQPPSEPMGLLMAALMLADELLESKKETDYFLHHPPDDEGRHITKLEEEMAGAVEAIAQRIEKIAEAMELR